MNEAFNKANEKMHDLERQWHYPILTKYGFTSASGAQKGFVRSYNYTHLQGHTIRAITGSHSDRWVNYDTGASGFWSSLEAHLKTLEGCHEQA